MLAGMGTIITIIIMVRVLVDGYCGKAHGLVNDARCLFADVALTQ